MPNVMNNHLTQTESAYLKAVFELTENGSPIAPSILAREFGVSRVSALEILRKLAAKGYGEYMPRRGLVLTTTGLRTAEAIQRKHRLFECLIYEKLGVPKADVCGEAAQVDQFLSDELAGRIDDALGHPETCPCGKPIKAANGG